MPRTGIDVVLSHRERLLSRRPALRRYRAVPLETIGWSCAQASAFIQEIWTRHYGEGVHLRFTPQMLSWMTNGLRADVASGSIAVLDEHGDVAAVVGGSPRRIVCHGQPRRAALLTALAVSPAHQGAGVGGLALCEQLVVNAGAGFDLTLAWHHQREAEKTRASSYAAYKANPAIVFSPVMVWGRTIELPKVRRHLRMGRLASLAASAHMRWSTLLARRAPNVEIVLDPAPHVAALARFVRRCTGDRPLRRETDVRDASDWTGPSVAGFFCAMVSGGEIVAVASGFSNPVGADALLHLDALLFDRARLSFRACLGFVREVDELARARGAFGLALPATCTNVSPAPFGFGPVAPHVLDATDLRRTATTEILSPNDLARAFIDLK